MYTEAAFRYPMDAVADGYAQPEDLTSDQLFGGVMVSDVWDKQIGVENTKNGGVTVYVDVPAGSEDGRRWDAGRWQAPAGLILRIWTEHEDGAPGQPYMGYVDSTHGVLPLRRDANGMLPLDVASRMTAEAASHKQARIVLDQSEPKTLYRGGRSYHENPVAAAVAGTIAAMHARARTKSEQRRESTFMRVVRGAAAIATTILGVQPTGRHHQPSRRHQPRFA